LWGDFSGQVALADVIRLLPTQEVDHRTAALMLYARRRIKD
jgi:hypothetical protein